MEGISHHFNVHNLSQFLYGSLHLFSCIIVLPWASVFVGYAVMLNVVFFYPAPFGQHKQKDEEISECVCSSCIFAYELFMKMVLIILC